MTDKTAIWGAPGCGKTTALKRIIDEINNLGLSGDLTTFRRVTANELEGEINLIHPASKINTMHGLCYDLLGGRDLGRVVEAKDIKDFEKMTNLHLSKGNKKTSIIDLINWLVNTGKRDITKYPLFYDIGIDCNAIVDTINAWKGYKVSQGVIDYSDMLHEVHKQKLYPNVDVLMVDEHQDLSYIQNKIMNGWGKKVDRLIIAGDPLQSIYGFLGGSPDFFNKFDGVREILPHSYRLPIQIWEYAKEFAAAKNMDVPEITAEDKLGKVMHMNYNEYLSNPKILEGGEGNKVYHLIRTNYQAEDIAKTFFENGIIFKGLRGWEKKDIDLLNAIIKIRNKLTFTNKDVTALNAEFKPEWISNSTVTSIDDYGEGKSVSSELIAHLRSPEPFGNPKYSKKVAWMRDAKFNNAILRHKFPIKEKLINTYVMTIHASKGLEADTVFLHTGITTKIKRAMSFDPSEEARVFYVGITRAKRNLVLVQNKGKNFQIPYWEDS
jgi:DNA helicase-2/ATP-dependent DNA helicase PcrA